MDAGRNSTLSTTHLSSIWNLETMASDCMRAFQRESTARVSTVFNLLNMFVQHDCMSSDISHMIPCTANAFAGTAHAPYHVTYA